MPSRRQLDEKGSLIVVIMVAAVVSMLVVASLANALFSQDTTVRAGSSAAALQLADAGVNQAVRDATNGGTGGPTTVSVPGAGSYTYSYTSAGTRPASWHIISVGKDWRGAQRKIEADAETQSLFADAIFANSGMHLSSGISVDSFTDGATAQDMCTGEGTVATDDVNSMTFGNQGNGNGVTNCTYSQTSPGYPVDGCIVYDDSGSTSPPSGSGACPPNDIIYEPGSYQDPTPKIPGTPTTSLVCTTPLSPGTYVYVNVTIESGCTLGSGVSMSNPVNIYATGTVQVGNGNGNVGAIDPPATPTCLSYTGKDVFGNPASYYCSGWAGGLRIYSRGTSVVFAGNHIDWWGIIYAPQAVLSTNNSPQISMWGALTVGSTAQNSSSKSSIGAQFALHYDQSLSSISSQQVKLVNWREEPCPQANCSATTP
jgi:hypothetical protein